MLLCFNSSLSICDAAARKIFLTPVPHRTWAYGSKFYLTWGWEQSNEVRIYFPTDHLWLFYATYRFIRISLPMKCFNKLDAQLLPCNIGYGAYFFRLPKLSWAAMGKGFQRKRSKDVLKSFALIFIFLELHLFWCLIFTPYPSFISSHSPDTQSEEGSRNELLQHSVSVILL